MRGERFLGWILPRSTRAKPKVSPVVALLVIALLCVTATAFIAFRDMLG